MGQSRLTSAATGGSSHGFTRADLLACVGVLVMLVMLALPGLATLRRDSSHAACVNNLRQVGRAHHVWGQDYDGRLPFNISIADGGINRHALTANVWFDFSWVSNHLALPRVLVCPADTQKKAAPDFGIFVAPGYRNASVSYFLATDVGQSFGSGGGSTLRGGPERAPTHILSGDRNIQTTGRSACSLPLNDVAAIATRPYILASFWTSEVHGLWGNLLLFDGQVRTAGYHTATNLAAQGDDNGSFHLLIP